jgi:hypothetical protein
MGVKSLHGVLWITQSNDSEDIVVRGGQSFVLDRPGLALISAPDRPGRHHHSALFYLTEKVRVIECRDRLQWILQCYGSVCPNSWGGWRHFNDAHYCEHLQDFLLRQRTPHHRSRLRAAESVSTADSANCPLPRPIRSPKSVPDTVFPSRRAECRDTYPALVYLKVPFKSSSRVGTVRLRQIVHNLRWLRVRFSASVRRRINEPDGMATGPQDGEVL